MIKDVLKTLFWVAVGIAAIAFCAHFILGVAQAQSSPNYWVPKPTAGTIYLNPLSTSWGLQIPSTPCTGNQFYQSTAGGIFQCGTPSGNGSSTNVFGTNGVTTTQSGVNATASLDTTYSATWTALEKFNAGLTANSTATFNSSTVFSVATATLLSADTTGKLQTTTYSGGILSFSGNTLTFTNPGFVTAASSVTWTASQTFNTTTTVAANLVLASTTNAPCLKTNASGIVLSTPCGSGTLSGSGTSTDVAFWNTSSSLTADDLFSYNSGSGILTVPQVSATTLVGGNVTVSGNVVSGAGGLSMITSGNGVYGFQVTGGDVNILPDLNGHVGIENPTSSLFAYFNTDNLGANRTFTFPDQNGTFAFGGGNGVNNNCVKWSGTSTLTDAGSPCGGAVTFKANGGGFMTSSTVDFQQGTGVTIATSSSGVYTISTTASASGTINNAAANQVAYYSATSTITGTSTFTYTSGGSTSTLSLGTSTATAKPGCIQMIDTVNSSTFSVLKWINNVLFTIPSSTCQ